MEKYTWIIQFVLALLFLATGIVKIKTSKEQLVKSGNMPPDGSITFIRFLGIAELLGSIAMIVPIWVPSLSIFTLLAAIGFGIVMLGAFVVHAKKKEIKKLPVLAIVLSMSILVFLHHL